MGKKMKKKGGDDGFVLLCLLGLFSFVLLNSLLMNNNKEKKKKKKKKKKANKASEEDSDDDKRVADARFNAMMEDLFGLVLLDSLLTKDKVKKKKKKKAESEPEEDGGDDKTEADTRFNAMMEDLFGLSVKSEEEDEKMKEKPGMKDNTSSTRGRRGGVSIKEDDEVMTMKVEMPGLGKEDVKVRVVNKTLLIETVDDDDDDDEDDENESGKKKNKKWGMHLPDDEYKYDEMKAVMKNGVLTVVVPKLKREEEKDAIHVVVED